ncbi:MAG: hypothetical protein Q4G03_07335 [Planctomycetia bacterium]|nr:hypothetical protein [Planctomycetia bacterium]
MTCLNSPAKLFHVFFVLALAISPVVAPAFTSTVHAEPTVQESTQNQIVYDSNDFDKTDDDTGAQLDSLELQSATTLDYFSLHDDSAELKEVDADVIAQDPPLPENATIATQENQWKVLIDLRHAYDFSDFPLTLDDTFYHRIYSFHRAFEKLENRGVQVDKYRELDEPITLDLLKRYNAVFLNLPSGDKSPFLVSEIFAFRDYVREGGGLFFIVDHTDCYFHQSRLTPLFHEIEIAPQFYGVCDSKQKLGNGTGWIYMDAFASHPVTENLRQIAFQTGGGVDPRFAVAWSSDESWQDASLRPIYGEDDLAYYGNFSHDDNEPVGASGVVLAKEFGKGKIVVVGDQNLFSAFFLQYLDIYRLWMNSFAWLLDYPELANVATYLDEARQSHFFVCWEELAPKAKRFGNPDEDGYYHLYTNLCRRYNVFCIANNDPEFDSNVTLILGKNSLSQAGLDFSTRQLEGGRALIIIDLPQDALSSENSWVNVVIRRLKDKGIELKSDQDENDAKLINRQVLLFSNGAKVVVINNFPGSYDNSSVPRPEARLLLRNQMELERLFDVINELNAVKVEE